MVVETIKKGNHTIEIFMDEYADSPRNWDNVAKIVCSHRRYSLGDEELEIKYSNNWKEAFAQHIADEYDLNVEDCYDLTEKEFKRVWRWIENNLIWDEVSLYDHSGISLSLGIRNGWDSGQVGYIYIHKDDAVENWGKEYLTKEVRKKAWVCIENEIKVYNDYLTGNVYGFNIYEKEHSDLIMSDGVYYGYDHNKSGLMEDAMSIIE